MKHGKINIFNSDQENINIEKNYGTEGAEDQYHCADDDNVNDYVCCDSSMWRNSISSWLL